MMMVVAPGTVRREKLTEAHGPPHWTPQPAGVARYVSFRDATASGVIGDARRANAQKGEQLVAAVRDAIVAILRDPANLELRYGGHIAITALTGPPCREG